MMSKQTLHLDLGGVSYHPDEPMTGIPRVTLSLAKEISHLKKYRDLDLNLSSLTNEAYVVPNNVLSKFKLAKTGNELTASASIIFLLDIYYYKFNFLNKLPSKIRKNLIVVDYIHDILPVTMKGLFDISEFKFKNLIRQSFLFSHAIMTPSKFTVDEIIHYITSNEEIQVGQSLKLGYSHHGADFSNNQIEPTTNRVNKALKRNYFLMVGTLEIRKNHLHVLNAFEKLWEDGFDATLCIAGKIGWKTIPFLEKIQHHPERNKRLIFINEPTDAELAQLYTQTYCLIFASSDEGFGLPIVEAAHYKAPLLLSDIAIFHEIAGQHARYFSLDDVNYLVEAIINFHNDTVAGVMEEDSSQIKEITWLQSATNILDNIIDDNWYCTIHADKSVEYHFK